MANKEAEEQGAVPAYVAWKTFLSFIEHIKKTVIPPRIDNSMMPPGMSGGTRSHLRSALKFLGLIRDDGYVTEKLKGLVGAYGTDSWAEALGEVLSTAYIPVVGDLDLDAGTAQQLTEQFRRAGHVDGDTLDRCIRFYLAAMRAAGYTLSPHFAARLNRPLPKRPGKKAKDKKGADEDETGDDTMTPADPKPAQGMRRFTIPIPRKADAVIMVPHDLTQREWELVNTSVRAFVALNTEEEDAAQK